MACSASDTGRGRSRWRQWHVAHTLATFCFLLKQIHVHVCLADDADPGGNRVSAAGDALPLQPHFRQTLTRSEVDVCTRALPVPFCSLRTRTNSSGAATELPQLAYTCKGSSDTISWNNTSPKTTIVLLHLFFPYEKECQRSFRLNTTSTQVLLPLDVLIRFLPYNCRALSHFYPLIALQQCNSKEACGPMGEKLDFYNCLGDPMAVQIHGNIKQRSVSMQVNTYKTIWPSQTPKQNSYHVLQRDVTRNITSMCNLTRVVCKAKKNRCVLTCSNLDPCAQYEFCVYVDSQVPGIQKARCQPGMTQWTPVSTKMSSKQADLLSTASLQMTGSRLSDTTAVVTIKSFGNSTSDTSLQVMATVCLLPKVDTVKKICQQRPVMLSSGYQFTDIVFTGLECRNDEYSVTATICEGCRTSSCRNLSPTLVKRSQSLVNITSGGGGEDSETAVSLHLSWDDTLKQLCAATAGNHENCQLQAMFQCAKIGLLPYSVSANQAELNVPWSALLPDATMTRLDCDVWVSLSLASLTPIEQHFPISQKRILILEVRHVQLPVVTPGVGNSGKTTGAEAVGEESTEQAHHRAGMS
eukprot:scpid36328/ scgid33545/ 